MLKNHIKIAWRNLKSNSLFSAINIIGLSLGLAITIVLYVFIMHEHSFDDMHSKKENIYRVLLHVDEEQGIDLDVWPQLPPVAGPTLMEDMSTVKSATRLYKHDFGGSAHVNINNTNFVEDYFYWSDNALFDIFDVEITQGNSKNPISNPNTAIISETTAKKYFGSTNPIGQTISVDSQYNLEITAVYKDFPSNSTLDCHVIGAFNSLGFHTYKSWDNASFETFCLLNENASLADANNQLTNIITKHVPEDRRWFTLSMQPFKDMHLHSAGLGESYFLRGGDIKAIKNISFLAALILLIACINYMNLITARSQKRSKDVGVNKTLGASTLSLIGRFYVETAVITLVALVLGVVLAMLAIPLFNVLVGQSLAISALLTPSFFIGIIIIFIVTTFLAGSYPALYLSGFSPKSILSPSRKRGKEIVLVRKGLVVFQFAASVVLIISVLVIYNQLQFMQKKQLGFNPEGVMAISIASVQKEQDERALVSEFEKLSTVSHVGLVQGYPGLGVSSRTLKKDANDENGIDIKTNVADAKISEVLQLNMLSGRMPSKASKTDSLVEVVLNKKAIDHLGYTPEEALGKKVIANVGDNASIVGVVSDFNFSSLRNPIGAYAFHNGASEGKSYMLVRFNTDNMTSVISQFRKTFSSVVTDSAFDYKFLDHSIKKLYEKEQQTANVSMVFCGLAILVACLGLFALAAFMAEQRTKEIGVRKVLGASIFNITSMLSKDFLMLVGLALVIAFPIAFWVMDNWLQEFAYRITIRWQVFFVAGLATVVIALLTVSSQAIRAAMVNPTKALRAE